jgi:lysophospholipase L1-like esterase
MSQRTYDNILKVTFTLEKLQIPYHFGFMYDPFDKNYHSMGLLDAKSAARDLINWDRFVPIYPLEIALRNPELTVDGFHLNHDGQAKFAAQLRDAGLGSS